MVVVGSCPCKAEERISPAVCCCGISSRKQIERREARSGSGRHIVHYQCPLQAVDEAAGAERMGVAVAEPI
jgi:hypothetical protein